jgi:hypothetical protein
MLSLNFQVLFSLVFYFVFVKGSESILAPNLIDISQTEIFSKAYNLYAVMNNNRTLLNYQTLQGYAKAINNPEFKGNFPEEMDLQFVIVLAASISLDEFSFFYKFVKEEKLSLEDPWRLEYLGNALIPMILNQNKLEPRSFLQVQMGNLLIAFQSLSMFVEKARMEFDENSSLDDLYAMKNLLETAFDILTQYQNREFVEEIPQQITVFACLLEKKLSSELNRMKILFNVLVNSKSKCGDWILMECLQLAKNITQTGGSTISILLEKEPVSFQIAFLLCLAENDNEKVFLDDRICNLFSRYNNYVRNDFFAIIDMALTKMRAFENLNNDRVLCGSIDSIITQVFGEISARL